MVYVCVSVRERVCVIVCVLLKTLLHLVFFFLGMTEKQVQEESNAYSCVCVHVCVCVYVCVCMPGVSSRSQVVVASLFRQEANVLWEHLCALSSL